MINVTKPFLPPKEEYIRFLDGIWERNWLTNSGPLVNDLELKLKDYLGLDHLLFLNNGTIALQIAIKALGLKGEIITTPFSYVATTSSIVWEGCTPVFTDIDAKTFNLDPAKIEAAITKNTSAILATHVYGNPCDIDAIQKIAEKHQLKVIYDAAHCFGTMYKGKSVFAYGDVSTTSFHATKLYHTIEGGAVITKDPDLLKKMAFMRNFGHNGPDDIAEVGINGKNSEFHAAMGVINLKHIDRILSSRKELSSYYDLKLQKYGLVRPEIEKNTNYNYAYYPVLFTTEEQLLKAVQAMNHQNIFPRRYFYPLLSEFFTKEKYDLPISNSVSKRILCLPLFEGLQTEQIDGICRLIGEANLVSQ